VERADNSDSDSVLTISKVNKVSHKSDNVFAALRLGNKLQEHLFQCDNGATCNILNRANYVSLFGDASLKDLKQSKTTLLMYNDTEVKPLGERVVRVINPADDKEYKVRFQIIDEALQSILGDKACYGMKLLTVNKEKIKSYKGAVTGNDAAEKENGRTDTVESWKRDIQELLKEFQGVFEGLGKLEGQLHLEIDHGVVPVKAAVRKIPLALREPVKAELRRLEELGVIVPVDSPTDWISPVVIVRKPDKSVRICLDPKQLNKALKRNHYPLLTLDDVLP
jgi:hypothetical protein